VALNALEVGVALASNRAQGDGYPNLTLADAEAALSARALRYERDEHYDVVSAFIKSVRGSDPDAGLYWLARMLAAGEDARFIARRLVILASEDVGMADPTSLLVADARPPPRRLLPGGPVPRPRRRLRLSSRRPPRLGAPGVPPA